MEEKIDIDKLRKSLIDYFGTAIFTASPLAIFELQKIEKASDYEIINIAIENNFNLNEYKYPSKTKYYK